MIKAGCAWGIAEDAVLINHAALIADYCLAWVNWDLLDT